LKKDINNRNISDHVIINRIRDSISKNKNLESKYKEYRTADKDGSETIFHCAVKHYRLDLCQYLLKELKFNINIKTNNGLTPLHTLINTNFDHHSATRAETSIYSSTSELENDSLLKFNDTLEFLIKNEADLNMIDNKNGQTVLHYAVNHENYNAVQRLVKEIKNSNIDINIKDYKMLTSLQYACKNGFDKIAKLLIDNTDVNNLLTDDQLPIHLACKNRNEKVFIIQQIMEKVKSIDPNKLKALLNYPDDNGYNLLQIAIRQTHLNIVQMLLNDYNADLNVKYRSDGNSLIHLVAKVGSVEILDILCQKNVDHYFLYSTNLNGDNALHLAASRNRVDFIKKFLSYEIVSRFNYIHTKIPNTNILISKINF
jgi:ankyrin repeat protein